MLRNTWKNIVFPSNPHLKEQCTVTAHAPNFDFRRGCREIKRYEESKWTLRNPFASRLAEFNITPKLLKITDQWYIVPVKLLFGRNRGFLASLLLPLARRTKRWEALWCRLKAYFFCQLPYKLRYNFERNIPRNETAKIKTVRKKPLRTLMWLRRSCGIKLREAELFATTR